MTTPSPDLDAVPRSRMRRRHWLTILSFLLFVVGPTVLAGWYLWERASDRYVSTVGFSVRTEEAESAIEMLGGIAGLSSSSGSDTEIMYNFIQSQELVSQLQNELGLRAIWAKGDPEKDPLFAYHAPGTIEDLVSYWRRMVKVYNDDSGLLELKVQAFTPEDAHAIAQMIFDDSSAMINRLSAIARADATGYARDELEQSVEKLGAAREALTRFRNRTQIVDPSASVQSQMGLLSSLQLQMAETLIELDLIKLTVQNGDPRISQLQRRVTVIEDRMRQEREKLGIGVGIGGPDVENAFADLVGEFERLSVDREFAEQSYIAALAAFDASTAQARRQSRYLAAHVRPTMAESPDHPHRRSLLGLVTLFSFLIWAIVVLTAYALRDRS
jgi:capsular polysaccharide transport system permease protein